MRSGNRSNALLVELLIVVLFFMLSAIVLLQVFSKARNLDDRAEALADATAMAQDIADRLSAAEDPEAALAAMGFAAAATGVRPVTWFLERDGLRFTVVTGEEPQPAGALLRCTVTVYGAEKEPLLTLPAARYREVSP